jgi:pyridoxal phosphate enzyme (YggS family)
MTQKTSDSKNPFSEAAKMALADLRADMAKAVQAGGRKAEDICLLAISKTKPAAQIEAFIAQGQCHFGENRVQEAAEKWPALKSENADIELHLVGPLQTKKVKQIIGLFDVVQTLDREKLARELAKHKDHAAFPKLYIQVNTGAEPQKSGILPQDVAAFHALCGELGLKIDGLMCLPPIDEAAGPHFALLGKLAAQLNLAHLSMGMSGDYQTAIALGATHIRVGTALFGARDTPESP